MGPLPDRAKFPPLDVQTSESTDEEGYRRMRISFAGDEQDRVPAYLLMPLGPRSEQRLPAMLALHQTIGIGKGEVVGLGGSPNLHYGRELAQRGYVVLAPDYPSFGDYRYDFQHSGYVSGTMKGIVNHMRAVDVLAFAAGRRSRADRRHRPLAGRPQRDVCGGVRPAAEGDRRQLRLDALPRLLRRQDRRLDQRPLHAAAAERLRVESRPRAVRFLRGRGGAGARGFFSNSPLGDGNFAVAGVKKAEVKARAVFALLGAADRLQIRYPDSGHDFPPAVRREAYAFVDQILQHQSVRDVPADP